MPRYWTVLFLAALAWSAAAPHDWFTWWMEMVPAAAVFIMLAAIPRRFAPTPLCQQVLLALCLPSSTV